MLTVLTVINFLQGSSLAADTVGHIITYEVVTLGTYLLYTHNKIVLARVGSRRSCHLCTEVLNSIIH